MSELFPNNQIDLENGIVYNLQGEKLGSEEESGYTSVLVFDVYGNKYKRVHQVIIAEALGLPKHEWPVDENGRQYEVDHIIPVSMGGTDSISNLRLVSRKDNANNPRTLERQRDIHKGQYPSYLYTEEIRKKIGAANKGKTSWMKGKHHTEEWKKAVGEKKKNHPDLSKPIIQIKDNGEVIEYPSIRECGRLGFTRHMIKECIDGKRDKYKGSKWREK